MVSHHIYPLIMIITAALDLFNLSANHNLDCENDPKPNELTYLFVYVYAGEYWFVKPIIKL